MELTALQLFRGFPPPSAASYLSDITNMVVGQSRVMIISTLVLDKTVRYPRYVHRTELDDCHWLCRAAYAGRRFATCPQPQPDDPSAAGRASASSNLGQTIPKLARRTTWLALLASRVSWALRWIWGVGQVMFVGLCCLFAHKHSHLPQLCSQFDLQSTPQDTPSLTTHSRQTPWTTTDFPPLCNMPQQTT